MCLKQYPAKKKEHPKHFKPDDETDTEYTKTEDRKSGRGTEKAKRTRSGNAEKEALRGA